MKILSATQTRALDAYTIQHEPIASTDLMERASRAFCRWFMARFKLEEDRPIVICCGSGNNGGDGWAIARLLHEAAYAVQVIACRIGSSASPDNQTNEKRLREKTVVPIHEIRADDPWPDIPPHAMLIDGLFGSGLSRPISGYWGQLVDFLNQQEATRIAIDIPSGLFADRVSRGTIFQADHTLSFQLPKLAFFLPENAPYVGQWQVVDIGLSADGLAQQATPFHHLTATEAAELVRSRGRFDHKGTFGHTLIIAGSYGKIGAAILSAKAALRAGCGLVTVHLPRCGYEIMQIAFPEAMVEVDKHKLVFTQAKHLERFSSIGIGPGIGTNELTRKGLQRLLEEAQQPLVLDADALNLLARHPELQSVLPPRSILTPHPKEFSRLFGETADGFAQLERLMERSQSWQCYIVLKGGYTAIASPDGQVFINTSGNPGMGTAGAGDVLTGVISSLLAQGYSPLASCQLGVCLHGLAGDRAAQALQQESLIAEDIIQFLGAAYAQLRNSTTKNHQ